MLMQTNGPAFFFIGDHPTPSIHSCRADIYELQLYSRTRTTKFLLILHGCDVEEGGVLVYQVLVYILFGYCCAAFEHIQAVVGQPVAVRAPCERESSCHTGTHL